MKDIDYYLDCYLNREHLKANNNKNSLRTLKSKLKKLKKYLAELCLEPGQLGVRQAQSFTAWLKEQKTKQGGSYKQNTLCRFTGVATGFYEYLKQQNVIACNPFKEIQKVKMEKYLPRHLLKPKEMNELLTALEDFNLEKDFYTKIRMYKSHVLSELLYSTALRINEAAGIIVDDVDIERGEITVKDSKSKKKRVVFLNEYAKAVLRIYVEQMREWVIYRDTALLFGTGSERLGNVLNTVLHKVCSRNKTNILTSHSFRHCVGYHLLKAGCDIRFIQSLLGHEKLKSTQVYTKVDKEDLKQVLDAFHPRQLRRKKSA